MTAAYKNIVVETHGKTGLIKLNRPKLMNAINEALIGELCCALDKFEADESIGCIVLTGSEKIFAAGADIHSMKDLKHMDAFKSDLFHSWSRIANCRKPIIAAVAGVALGGGFELALMCDIVIAADNAQFGLPEIKLGTMPAAGGTQRLPRAIGKSKAMEMCLAARVMDAVEAERAGLVSRIVPVDKLLQDALSTAEKICGFSLPVAMMIKESVNRAFESSLHEGLLFERRVFHSTFGLDDRKEGMTAFIQKRKPDFKHS